MGKSWKAIVEFVRALYKALIEPIPLHESKFRGNEKKYLAACTDSTYASSVGPYLERLKKMVTLI